MATANTARRLVLLAALSAGTALVSSAVSGCKGNTGGQAQKPAAAAAPRLNWPTQHATAYALHIKNTSNALGAPGGVAFSMKGRLEVAARRSGTDTQLALRVVGATFDSEGKAVDQYAALATELGQTYLVSQRGGVTSAEYLPHATSTFAASLLRSLAAALQMGTGSPAADGSWKTSELDGTGKYEIEYRPLAPPGSGGFARKKLKYEPTAVPNPNPLLGPQKLEPRVVASSGKLRLGPEGVLQELSFSEEVSLPLLKGVVGGHTELTLVLQPDRPSWSVDWQALQAAGVAATPGMAFGQGAAPELLDAQRIGDYTFASALKELREAAAERELAKQGKLAHAASELRTRAFSAMVGILRLQPETLPQASAAISKAEPVASMLADALASAGTPAAQAVLVELLRGGEATKRQAAASLVRVENPTEASERAVRGLCSDSSYLEFCLYGMGTYARKLRSAGQTARSDALGQALIERLAAAAPGGVEQQVALRGIANSGDGAAFATVAPLLTDEASTVRIAAVDAIRLMPGADVEKALIERLEHDTSTGARLGVVGAAIARPRSEALTAAVERAASKDANSGVRSQCVRALAKWLPETPRLHSVIAKIAESDANPAVKATAAAVLGESKPTTVSSLAK